MPCDAISAWQVAESEGRDQKKASVVLCEFGGPGPANNQALYYSILLYQKTDSLDLKENAQEIIQTNERRQAFFDKYN